MSEISIEFVNTTNATYRTGSTMEGMVVVLCGHENPIDRLHLKIRGEAQTAFSLPGQLCSGSDMHLDKVITLDTNAKPPTYSTTLKKYVHKFEFQCIVPETCPPTYQHNKGSIAYQAIIKCRIGKYQHCEQFGFNVAGNDIINADSNLLHPYSQTVSRKFGLFVNDGLVEMTVTLEKTIFCIGERVPLKININNHVGSSNVNNVSYRFSEHVILSGKNLDGVSVDMVDKNKIMDWVKIPNSNVNKGDVAEINSTDFIVVPQVNGVIWNSKLISIVYLFEVKVEHNPFTRCLKMKIPIKICASSYVVESALT